jgi:cyclopropane-fatty-acyl-phospholipid synthase
LHAAFTRKYPSLENWYDKEEAPVMSRRPAVADGRATEIAVHVLDRLFAGAVAQDLAVRLWDGTAWPDATRRRATIVLRHPGALRAMFLPGHELGMAEAYIYDDFDVDGEIEAVFGLADVLAQATSGRSSKLGVAAELLRLPKGPRHVPALRGPARLSGTRHSIARDRQAVTYHYDLSNDFFALWLDSRMAYSCGYFQTEGEDLEAVQGRKLDYICRKLRLEPGQRFLDLGCGWGGLLIHAAGRYGVDATGITLSRPQAELATERIAAAGVSDRCRALVRDYRELEEVEAYDALASVGMFEHVGEALLPTYFARARRLLRPGGVFLNHGIASAATENPKRGPGFSDAYVFPDGELTPINVTLRAAEEAGFEVRDVESLREHYMLTLRHWVRRLEAHHKEALAFVDEPTYRVWRLFMAGSAHGFAVGRHNVYQALLVKPDASGRSGLPLTRADWY